MKDSRGNELNPNDVVFLNGKGLYCFVEKFEKEVIFLQIINTNREYEAEPSEIIKVASEF